MIVFAMEKLKEIFFDFLDNLEEKEYLCELKNFGFKGEVLPDYQNQFIQQYYLLKYFPAYLTEYYFLYNEIIKKNFLKDNYNILSIGCINFRVNENQIPFSEDRIHTLANNFQKKRVIATFDRAWVVICIIPTRKVNIIPPACLNPRD